MTQRSFEQRKTFSVSEAVPAPTANKSGRVNPESVALEFSVKAYKDRPTSEMLRSYLVYKMFAYESLVNNGETVCVLYPTCITKHARSMLTMLTKDY